MIETGIAIPSREKYVFNEMAVGDSIFCEGQDSQGKAMGAAKTHGVYHGKKFAARKVEGGVRIWRVA